MYSSDQHITPALGCVSDVLSSPGVVEVYDGMPFYSITSYTLQKQIAAIMKT